MRCFCSKPNIVLLAFIWLLRIYGGGSARKYRCVAGGGPHITRAAGQARPTGPSFFNPTTSSGPMNLPPKIHSLPSATPYPHRQKNPSSANRRLTSSLHSVFFSSNLSQNQVLIYFKFTARPMCFFRLAVLRRASVLLARPTEEFHPRG